MVNNQQISLGLNFVKRRLGIISVLIGLTTWPPHRVVLVPPKRGRGRNHPPPPPPDSPPDYQEPIFSSQKSLKYGLFFHEEEALNRFEELRHWKQNATLFPRLNALRFLHAYEAVAQLFEHIGWTPALQWKELSYWV